MISDVAFEICKHIKLGDLSYDVQYVNKAFHKEARKHIKERRKGYDVVTPEILRAYVFIREREEYLKELKELLNDTVDYTIMSYDEEKLYESEHCATMEDIYAFYQANPHYPYYILSRNEEINFFITKIRCSPWEDEDFPNCQLKFTRLYSHLTPKKVSEKWKKFEWDELTKMCDN